MSENYTLITGASSGIGKSFADELASRGENLILLARREERLQSIAKELKEKFKIEVEIFPIDLLDRKKRDLVFKNIFSSFKVTHVINNAGVGFFRKFASDELRNHHNTLNLNIDALVDLSYNAIKHMQEHKISSHITNISSIASFVSIDKFSVYCGTKHFVRSFSEALSIELADSNINVTCISPGGVATEFLGKAGQSVGANESIFLMDSQVLVEKSLKAITHNKLHYTPGVANQLTLVLMKFLPKQIGNRLASFVMNKAVKTN